MKKLKKCTARDTLLLLCGGAAQWEEPLNQIRNCGGYGLFIFSMFFILRFFSSFPNPVFLLFFSSSSSHLCFMILFFSFLSSLCSGRNVCDTRDLRTLLLLLLTSLCARSDPLLWLVHGLWRSVPWLHRHALAHSLEVSCTPLDSTSHPRGEDENMLRLPNTSRWNRRVQRSSTGRSKAVQSRGGPLGGHGGEGEGEGRRNEKKRKKSKKMKNWENEKIK